MVQSDTVQTPEKVGELRDAMFALKYESMLQAVHPMVATNVTRAVADLLRLLGREDLAEEWVRL